MFEIDENGRIIYYQETGYVVVSNNDIEYRSYDEKADSNV